LPGLQEKLTHGPDDGHISEVVRQVNWPAARPWLQKQQSTGVAKAVLPPVILLHVHVVVRDPARACETPHVAVCWEQGVVWQLSLYSTHGHIGCVGDEVGEELTHPGSMNLQCLPGTSKKDATERMFNSKVVR